MNCTVLIVDDDFDIRDTLSDLIGDEGYQTAVAKDGLEALDYLRANPKPCVILLDWMMPKCDGATFRAEQVKDPGLADVPVVLVTADANAPANAHALKLAGYLKKPVDLVTLQQVLSEHCAKSARPSP